MDQPAALRTKTKDELVALLVAGAAATAEIRSNYETAQVRCRTAEAEVDKLHLLIKQLRLVERRATQPQRLLA